VLAVEEHGRELFEAAQGLDLEGIVAKRKADLYSPQTTWYKVKNPAYTQAKGPGRPVRAKPPVSCVRGSGRP
jgi:hypothetical protein